MAYYLLVPLSTSSILSLFSPQPHLSPCFLVEICDSNLTTSLASSLSGTGLLSQPQPRYVPICSELSLGFSGPLKFQWKIFNGASSGDSGKAPASNLRNEATPAESGHSWATSTKADGSEEVVFTLEAIKANSGWQRNLLPRSLAPEPNRLTRFAFFLRRIIHSLSSRVDLFRSLRYLPQGGHSTAGAYQQWRRGM